MKLNQLRDNRGARKRSKLLGRGIGSGKGKTAGRGVKGQKARTGVAIKGFEGGQMPLIRRLPKRGFTNPTRVVYAPVNVCELEQFENGTEVSLDLLRASGLFAAKFDGVKILGSGDLTKKLTVKANGFSATAKAKIEAAGGTVEVV